MLPKKFYLICVLQCFSLDWLKQKVSEHSTQDSNMEGFIEIILEKNASAASTEIRMGMKERSFPSIVMVGSKSHFLG